jgi:NADH-quinone oxidoreductase subunit N
MNAQTVFVSMLPEHLLLLGICVLIVVEVASAQPKHSLGIAVATVVAASIAALLLNFGGYAAAPFIGHFSVTPDSSIAKAIVLSLALPVLMLSRDDFRDSRFPLLLLSSLYGVCLLVSSDSFLTLFLGLELMSLPVYVLVLLAFQRSESAEAALKYLVLGGAATATLLMGISLLFGWSGSLAVTTFADALNEPGWMTRAAIVMILAAFFLKAAIFPFHAWAPDAYEGASVPVTAYMATVVKAAVLLAVLRLLGTTAIGPSLAGMIVLLPLVSIVWGNVTAMRQSSFRRMIAYSSIAHAGYLFFALLGAPSGRFEAIAFYVLAYGLMNVLAFAALPSGGADAERDRLASLKGLYHRRPYAAITLAVAMLSLAGIPPLPGFVAKFLVFRNVMAAGHTEFAVLGLLGSYLGIYFYLRVIQFMFMSAQEADADSGVPRRLALGASLLCLAPIVVLTVFPGLVLGRL